MPAFYKKEGVLSLTLVISGLGTMPLFFAEII
jgi:hypothetical protein